MLLATWIGLILFSIIAYVQKATGIAGDVEVSAKVIIFGLASSVCTLALYVAILHKENGKIHKEYKDTVRDMQDKHAEKMENLINKTHQVMMDHREAVNNNTIAQKEQSQSITRVFEYLVKQK